MIMMGDKKKALTQILGPEKIEEESGGDSALHSIASELIDAVQAGDVEATVNSLRAAVHEIKSEG